jgi:hypothetical protein
LSTRGSIKPAAGLRRSRHPQTNTPAIFERTPGAPLPRDIRRATSVRRAPRIVMRSGAAGSLIPLVCHESSQCALAAAFQTLLNCRQIWPLPKVYTCSPHAQSDSMNNVRPRSRVPAVLASLHCPHHAALCVSKRCCCRDRHWRPIKVARELREFR